MVYFPAWMLLTATKIIEYGCVLGIMFQMKGLLAPVVWVFEASGQALVKDEEP
jgi:hypothetical protein